MRGSDTPGQSQGSVMTLIGKTFGLGDLGTVPTPAVEVGGRA